MKIRDDIEEIMIPEAKFILEKQLKGIQENRTVEERKLIGEIFSYLKKHTKISQENSVIEFKSDLKKHSLSDREISQIGSLLPQTSEELKILIPSLNKKSFSELNEIESKIQKMN